MQRTMASLLGVCALIATSVVPTSSGRVVAATGREPVIIIPGIAGSEFTAASAFRLSVDNGHGGRYTRDYSAGEKVWVNSWEAAKLGEDDYFDVLKLRADGVTPVAPALQVSGVYGPAYDDLIGYLQRQGYVLGVDLWLFPYDWRKDIRTTASRLDAVITQALIAANSGRIDPTTWTIKRADIVGHSMGGLVGRYYISDPARASRIDQLITLGSPQLGTPSFLKVLIYGSNYGLPFLSIGPNPNEVKDVVQNMPGGMQLLPSRAYYTYYDNSNADRLRPYVEDRDVDGDGRIGGVLNYVETKELLLNLRKNPTVINMAETWHDALDRQRNGGINGVRWAALVGYSIGTPGQLRAYTGSCLTLTGYQPCPKWDETPVDGDGAVAVMSAAMGDPWRNSMINSGAQRWYIRRGHSDLVKRDYILGIPTGDGPALRWIGSLLHTTTTAPSLSSMSLPLADAPTTTTTNHSSASIDRTPSGKLNGAWIAALGPVSLQVRDVDGRTTGRSHGQSAAPPAGIPESHYEQLPGSEFVFGKRDAPYTLTLSAENEGSTDLKVRVLANGKVERTAVYLGIRLSANGRAQLVIKRGTSRAASPQGWPVLQIDADGDGVFEASMSASAVLNERDSADITAPDLVIDAPTSDQAMSDAATIRWRGSDSGSGILFEQATLNPGTAMARQVANDEIALPAGEHRLLIVAVDRAGNASSREITFVKR